MEVQHSSISGAVVFTPTQHGDERGVFLEWYRAEWLAGLGTGRLDLAQANCSVSRRGVLRGIHFADVPPGQAKFVTCLFGAVLDVWVDLRVGSPTFGEWESAQLDDRDRRAVYLTEGLGHAFMALSDGATVAYLCSKPYAPRREHGVHPLDSRLGIRWPTDIAPVLSPRDAASSGLAEMIEAGLLPRLDACQAHYLSGARNPDAGKFGQ